MALICWLPLLGTTTNQGCGDIIVTANGASIDNNGKIGKCYSFNGNDYYISLVGEQLFQCFTGGTTAFSICMWVYHADARRAILFGDYGTSGSIGFNVELYTGHGVRFYWNGSPDYNTAINVGLNTWSHIAITYDGAKLKSYLNGILVATRDGALATRNKTTGEFRLGRDSRTIDTALNGKLNDIRVYKDHCLSAAEVKEIAQGLILHYPFNDEYMESTVNYSPSPYKTNYSTVSPGWDTSKHLGAIGVNNWSNGYNGGVSNPSTGYHAMWNLIDNIPTVVFQNHNSEIGAANRWLGVSSVTISINIPAGVKYTISYEQRTIDTLGGYTTSGIYYKYNSSSSTSFHDGCPKIGQNTKLNIWERFSYTFTRSSNMDGTGTNGTIYIYGYSGTESTMQVRNIQLEINDHATPYTINERTSNNINISSTNLITGLTAGGRTTISGGTVTTTGTDADTYFYINLSTPMIKNHLYKISCNVSGLAGGGYWNFPIAAQSNNIIPAFRLVNGYNELIFRANDTCVSAGTKVILDDNGATSRAVVMTANNFKLIDITPIIQDNSGYGNNGILIGEFTMKDSPRYNKCLYLNSFSPTTNDEKGICYIQTSFSLTTPSQMTIAWWAKPESGYGDSVYNAAFCTSNDTNVPTDYNMTAFHHRDSGFDIYPSDGSGVKRLSFSYTKNEQHHYAVTYDGTTARTYQDGVLKTSIEVGTNKTLASFSQLYIGFSKAGGVWRKTKGSYSDFRIYCTALSSNDILALYHTGAKVDNLGNLHTFEATETQSNIIFKIDSARGVKVFQNGLSSYTQANCQVTLTDNGYRIYRPPNLSNQANGGSNNMWGGLELVNQTTNIIAAYDANRDNNWNLQQGHTYLFAFHAKGQSSNGTTFSWTNFMGWGGGGVSPSPTQLVNDGIPANFQGEKDCIYIFTIGDTITKNCTSAYSSYSAGTTYLSYRHLTFGWGYTNTGALGTDIYLTNFRLYDITNIAGKIKKNGQASFSDFVENNSSVRILKNAEFLTNNLIEL